MKKNYVFAQKLNGSIVFLEKETVECNDIYEIIREVTPLENQMMDIIFDYKDGRSLYYYYYKTPNNVESEYEFIFAFEEDMKAKQKHLDSIGIVFRYSLVEFV